MRMISEGCRRHTSQWPCFYQLEYEMNNSQGKNNFQPLSSTMATLPTASATFIDKGGDAHSKRWKSWCYFAMIGSHRLVFPVGRHIHQDFQREKSYDHRESALRLSSGFKNRANFAAKVELLRNWSSTIMLPYGFAFLYGGIAAARRNQAIFLKVVIIRQSYARSNIYVKYV